MALLAKSVTPAIGVAIIEPTVAKAIKRFLKRLFERTVGSPWLYFFFRWFYVNLD